LHYKDRISYANEDSSGLFGSYIDRWLKIKIEASGWPSSVNTPEERAAYVQMYKEKENITIDPERVSFNPGLRSLAKKLLFPKR